MKAISWDFVIGFFEGEGTCCTYSNRARRGNYGTVVSMCQSGSEGQLLLIEIRDFLVAQGISCNVYGGNYKIGPEKTLIGSKRPMWSLRMSSRVSCVAFLKAIRSSVRIKKQVVEDTLRFLTLFPEPERGLYFKELNAHRKATGWYVNNLKIGRKRKSPTGEGAESHG